MRHYTCDRTRVKLTPDETTTLKLSGPLRSMTGRGELHLAKDQARELAAWFGFATADPVSELGPFGVDLGRPAPTAPASAPKRPRKRA